MLRVGLIVLAVMGIFLYFFGFTQMPDYKLLQYAGMAMVFAGFITTMAMRATAKRKSK